MNEPRRRQPRRRPRKLVETTSFLSILVRLNTIGYAFRELKKKKLKLKVVRKRCIGPPGGSVQAASSRFVSLSKIWLTGGGRCVCACLVIKRWKMRGW